VDDEVDDDVEVGELEVDVDVLVVVSSSDSVVRVAVLEPRLGANELFGSVLDVLVRDGAVVSVGVLGSGVTLSAGSLVAVVTGAGVVTVDADGLIPAMLNVAAGIEDADGSTGVVAGSTR